MSHDSFFSLVVCTLNRDINILMKLFNSLVEQEYLNFEVILMDQNQDDRLKELASLYTGRLKIIHIKSTFMGLSANRNKGIDIAKGDVICFPDDDCFYDKSTLRNVNNFFRDCSDIDFYCCSVQDSESEKLFPMPRCKCEITTKNFYNKCISIGIFYKPSEKRFLFDERLGAGAEFGAGEESDFISNLLYHGLKGYYNGLMYVYHPLPATQATVNRYYSYALGAGALIKKEIIVRKKYSCVFPFMIEVVARLALSLLPIKKKMLYWHSFKGRVKGFCSY